MSHHRRFVAIGVALMAMTGLGTANAQAGALPGDDPGVTQILDKMTLEEKVAQLFVLQVYGKTADTTDPTAVAANQKLYGLGNAEQLIAKYQPGGIIYYS